MYSYLTTGNIVFMLLREKYSSRSFWPYYLMLSTFILNIINNKNLVEVQLCELGRLDSRNCMQWNKIRLTISVELYLSKFLKQNPRNYTIILEFYPTCKNISVFSGLVFPRLASCYD